ncbi:hypothetical protein [Streptomyces sp. NPDC051016]|uniref:hypothetical protein n=1 Tax=Streptomyces sp. NPDC051016 TaxID=3365638 RepID=UPI0037A19D18
MNLLTPEDRVLLANSLGHAPSADGDAVLRTLGAIRYAELRLSDTGAVRRALAGSLSVLQRLADVEKEYATTRAAIAQLVVANNRGDDRNLGDLAFQLEQAGIDLKTDYDIADDLARAAESEAL